ALSLQGETSLSTSFACDCQVGDAPLRGYFWELGDLGTASTPTASATFVPGRYRVRLTVVDGNGLTAADSVEVAVTSSGLRPPECRVGLSPPAGPAPLTVSHRAVFGDDDGSVVASAIVFSDGAISTEPEPTRTYDRAGRYRTVLKVTDNSGLTCVDLVEVAAIGSTGQPPPGFLSAPRVTGQCGVAYQYSDLGRPLVSGSGPFQFELAPVAGGTVPEGMTVDPDTGAIRWMPSSRNAGANRVVLRAISADGVAEQLVDVNITCGDKAVLSAGCMCSQAGGASWIAVVAGMLALLARMRWTRWARARAGARARQAAPGSYSPALASRRRLPR
ncbi:MAG TPA: PKD domain-containing protein, partial [Myxococcales bacterium]|nr:PKD domain-containing protein [Myxococcales bacterium]